MKSLNLCESGKFSEIGIAALANLTNLEFLDLSWCYGVNDVSFPSLLKLKKLQSLNLKFCKVTDVSFALLSNFPDLRYLDLGWSSEVTDKRVLELAELKNLKELNIMNCENVTPEAVAKAEEINPSLKIKFHKHSIIGL